MMPTFIDKSFPQKVLQIIRDYLSLHFLYDCVIHIETQRTIQNTSSNTQTDEIYAHRLVLAATSNFFREIFLVKKDQRDAVTKVNLKLYTPNAVNCFKVILGFLYSGELHLRDCDPKDILQVAKVCQITVLEDYLISESSPKVLKQPPPSPIDVKPDNKDQKDSNRPAEPIRPNPFGNDQKQAEGSLVSTFFPQVASTMAYVPVQSTTAGMPSTPTTVTLPTISAAEIRSHLFQHGYFGPILPTTGNLLSPAPHSAPPYSGPIHQNYQSVIQMALNAPRPGSATNGHRASLAAGGDGMIQLQPVPKKMTAKRANAKLMQGLSPPDAPFDNLGDVIVPSSEKEGRKG
uniref:BTB domain-containing protein n=1 Tax=Plectus sambesii TaxID=2011161 RepID=A0A914XNN6_9BILA